MFTPVLLAQTGSTACQGFQPVVENELIPDVPILMRERGDFHKVHEMLGLTEEDGFGWGPSCKRPLPPASPSRYVVNATTKRLRRHLGRADSRGDGERVAKHGSVGRRSVANQKRDSELGSELRLVLR